MKQKRIEKFSIGEIITTESFAKKLGIEEDTAREMLKDKITFKKIFPMFRLMTKDLEFNPWTPELSLLGRMWNLKDGSQLNGGDPKNIEVGFIVCSEF